MYMYATGNKFYYILFYNWVFPVKYLIFLPVLTKPKCFEETSNWTGKNITNLSPIENQFSRDPSALVSKQILEYNKFVS